MEYNLLQYAHLGDAVYEMKIREYLIKKGIVKIKDLKEESLNYVTAKKQAYFVSQLEEFLNTLEKEIIRKGRNVKTNSKPKYCDIVTYKYATAFEALIGKLYLDNKENRIDEIVNKIIEIEKDEVKC